MDHRRGSLLWVLVNNLYIQRCFTRPPDHVLIGWVKRFSTKWVNDLNVDRWQTKLLIEDIHVLLQCGAAKRHDIHYSLPFAREALLSKRLHAVGNPELIRRVAVNPRSRIATQLRTGNIL